METYLSISEYAGQASILNVSLTTEALQTLRHHSHCWLGCVHLGHRSHQTQQQVGLNKENTQIIRFKRKEGGSWSTSWLPSFSKEKDGQYGQRCSRRFINILTPLLFKEKKGWTVQHIFLRAERFIILLLEALKDIVVGWDTWMLRFISGPGFKTW